MDGTGLRPTTDGSAGSKDIADKYMIETYPKQYESVIESLPPIPEPPKPEPPKPSKPTQKSPSTPSYIKQYNPDHNEFEPAYTIEKAEGTSGGENINDVDSGKADVQEFIEGVVSNYTVDKMADTATAYWANSIVRHSILETSKAIDDILRFTPVVGVAIDASLRIIEGEEINHAVNKAVLVTMSVSSVIFAVGAIGITMSPWVVILLAALIDSKVSSIYDNLLKF